MNIIYIFATLILLIIFGLNIMIPLIFLSLLFSYKILDILLNKSIFNSKTFVILISTFFYILILQSVVLVTWIFYANISLILNIPVTFALLALSYYLIRGQKKTYLVFRETLNRADVVSLIVVLSSIFVMVYIPIYKTGINKPSSIFSLINSGVDDSSHIGILNDKIQFDRAVILDSSVTGQTRAEGAGSSLANWHSANAAIIKSFNPKIETGIGTIVAYILNKVFWFALLVYMFVRTIFSLYEIYSKKRTSIAISVWIFFSSSLFTGWFLSSTFFEGFYGFIPQLIIIPIFILSLVQISLPKKDYETNLANSLLFPALLCAGTALSWLLLFPVFLLTVVLCLIDKSIMDGFWKSIKEFFYTIPRIIMIYVAIVGSVLIQTYILSKGVLSISFIQGILLTGGILTYPESFYGFILIGLIIFLLIGTRKNTSHKIKPILNYMLSILIFTALLYFIQLYARQTTLYYYYKALNTFTLMGAILCVIGFSFVIDLIQSRATRLYSITLSLIMALLLLQFVYPRPAVFTYLRGSNASMSRTNEQLYNILKTSYTQANYYDKEVSIFYPDDSPVLNEVGSSLLKSNKPMTGCYWSLKVTSFTTPPTQFNTETIFKNCQDAGIRITYYVRPYDIEHVQQTIKNSGLEKKVTVKVIAN